MSQRHTLKIILGALFIALICIATILIQIPTPGTGGYANLGDGLILLAAFLLPQRMALIVSMLGACLADLLSGYTLYAPGTLLIKGLSALIAATVCRKHFRGAYVLAGILAELTMTLGYLCFESSVLGYGMGALASVPANLMQGLVGILIALLLLPALTRSHVIQNHLKKLR